MNVHSEIDDTLRRLGSVEPPSGLERRVNQRLQASQNASRNRFSASMTRTIAACALAASVALSAVVLNPALRSRVFHHHTSAQSAASGQYSTGGGPGVWRVRNCFGGTRAGRAGPGAAHAREPGTGSIQIGTGRAPNREPGPFAARGCGTPCSPAVAPDSTR